MSEITHVCFDIGGVANVRTPDYIIVSQAGKHFGKIFSEEDLRKMIHPKLEGRDIWREFQNGAVDAEQYIDAAFRIAEVPLTLDNKIFFYRLLEDWCGVSYQPILNLADRLKQNSYYTSILSNNNEIMYNTPSAEAIKSRVDVAISSHEIGFSKPNIPAYIHLLDAIGGTHLRHGLIFVDDQEKNIEMANKLGINGFHFRSKKLGMDEAFAELMEELKGKGIRV